MTKHGPPIARRSLMAASAALGVSVPGAGQAQAQVAPTTFVLVHGAWHGGWCWRRVADRLQAKGHKVFAQSLSGLAERSNETGRCAPITLDTHITDVENLFHWEGISDAVLCGHSYGGMVVSGALERLTAMQGAVRSVVFLDAFLPADGQSLADLATPALRDKFVKAQQQGDLMPPVPAAAFHVNEQDRAWVDRLCTPQPVGTLMQPVRLTGARERIARKTYVRAIGYPAPPFDEARSRVAAEGGWRTFDLECGHDAMIDLPDRVTEILIDAS